MRHFMSNIIAGVIWKKSLRDKVRVMIRYPQTHIYTRFVRGLARDRKKCNIKTVVGYGCKNWIVILNNKRVFKFPLLNDGHAIALREKRITDVFSKISPIKIPVMKIIKYNDVYVREYEFAKGKLLTDVPPQIILHNSVHIAKQLANFLHTIGKSDPKELRDLKPDASAKPGYMYGWFQGDIWQNFMLDEKTLNITYFLDWEGTNFEDFRTSLRIASHNWDKFGYKGIIVDVLAEYSKLYMEKNKK